MTQVLFSYIVVHTLKEQTGLRVLGTACSPTVYNLFRRVLSEFHKSGNTGWTERMASLNL